MEDVWGYSCLLACTVAPTFCSGIQASLVSEDHDLCLTYLKHKETDAYITLASNDSQSRLAEF